METQHGIFRRNLNPIMSCAILLGGCVSGRVDSDDPDVGDETPEKTAEQLEKAPSLQPVGLPRMLSGAEIIELRVARTGSPAEPDAVVSTVMDAGTVGPSVD